MALLPTYTVELPRLDHSDSSPASCMWTAEQSSPIVPYYSTSRPATTAATTFIYGWPLSPSTPLSYPEYSPCCLGLTFQPTPAPFNTSACNYLPTAMPSRMPSSSSVPPANRASPIAVFGAASPRFDFERFNDMQASTSTGFASPCSSPDSLGSLQDQAGATGTNGGDSGSGKHDLKRRRSTPSEPIAEAMTSWTAPMELALGTDASTDVAPSKRSRTAQVCERCRIRKARCFGGDPCNLCIKRKFNCEFTRTRQRGSNKPLSHDLPVQNLNLHSQQQSQADHHIHPHAHGDVHLGVPLRPVSLARAHTHSHARSTRPRARRHSMAMVNSGSSMMPAMTSVFRPLPMPTAPMPYPEAPALGLGLELNLKPAIAIDEDTDGRSDPDMGNPSSASSAPLSAINCNSNTFLGFGMGSTITIPSTNKTLNPFFPNLNPEYDMYTPLMKDEMMFSFSPHGVFGNCGDVDGSYDYLFAPVTSTIPLPLPALGSLSSSQINTAHDETAMAMTS